MPKDTRWDEHLSVDVDGNGLVGHAGAVLLRERADATGLTSALGAALPRAGTFPLTDREVALVSTAVTIVLGATSMTDIALLDHQAAGLRAAAVGHDRAADAGAGRRHDPAQGREGAGADPRARVEAGRRDRRGVPVAGHRRQDPDGLAGHRHGRHADHRALQQGGRRAHL